MRKKALLIIMVMCMLTTALIGCSSKEDPKGSDTSTTDKGTGEISSDEEPYDAVMVYLVASDSQDSDMVSEKFNELTKRDLNMNVKLIPMTFSTWGTQMQLMLSGGEQVDLFPMMMNSAPTYIASGYVVDLAPYIEKADYLMESVGEDDIWCNSVGDFLWGVPTMKERANPVAMIVRTDCLEAAGV
ncbi:MAG TPA: extracellular solute-binding protein, partial [Candidatus Merdenecus merdavium]|nr:extracellular solute-binding protein [Candidatus Merdenecus merdavium]